MQSFKHPRNREYHDYWSQLPRDEGALIPRRSRFLPEDVPGLLATMVIYELVSGDEVLIRLQGTSINERFGRDLTGENYLDYVSEDRRAKASEAFWLMAEHPCGAWVSMCQRLTSGRDVMVEALGYPVINDQGKNPILIFQSNAMEAEKPTARNEEEELQVILLRRRILLDLGNGIPDFHD